MSIIHPIILLELGSTQFYYYGEQMHQMPINIYYHYLAERTYNKTFGPFPTMHDALSHFNVHNMEGIRYTNVIPLVNRLTPKPVENVTYVNFKEKKRIFPLKS